MSATVSVILDSYHEYRRPESPGIPFEESFTTLLNQTYPKELVEILIIALPQYSSELRQNDSRVRWVIAPQSFGYYQKKTYGGEIATSDILLFADGDCLYPPDWIEQMVSAFERAGER